MVAMGLTTFLFLLALQPPAGAPVQATAVEQSQAPAPGDGTQTTGQPRTAPRDADEDDESEPQPAEPEFNLVNLPTTLRLPRHRANFRVTHRFLRDLRQGDFGNLLGDMFGLDNGAAIGLEFRYAPIRHLEAGIHRSSVDKTIAFFGKYDGWHQGTSRPLSISLLASIEGEKNFHTRHQPALGLVLSRTVNDTLALYATPVWVHNTNLLVAPNVDDDTVFLGLGGRVRFRPTAYLVAEVSPRLAGFAPQKAAFAFGVEKRVGGHVFQLNFSNNFDTTFGQLARGGDRHNLYLGFNIARKFF